MMIAIIDPTVPRRGCIVDWLVVRRGSRREPGKGYDYFGPQEPSGAFPASEPTPIATGCDTMPL